MSPLATWAGLVALAMAGLASGPPVSANGGPPTTREWTALARLPDWGGIWTPDLAYQVAQFDKAPPPWTPKAAARAARMAAEEKAGHPENIYLNCLPEGMPGFILISRNAMEFLFTPGRVTVLGEFDGNRLRRIYTDGRPHPADPDPTFHGHSIGHWEGQTLVVDTTGILPEAYLPYSQAVAVPNDGDMQVVEHVHLTGPDELHDDLVIEAPHVLSAPWITTRIFHRQRGPGLDIVEASCLQGDYAERLDPDGDAVFAPIAHAEGGAPIPGDR